MLGPHLPGPFAQLKQTRQAFRKLAVCPAKSLRAPGKGQALRRQHVAGLPEPGRPLWDRLVIEDGPHWSLFTSQVGAKHLTPWRPLRTMTDGQVPRSPLIPQMRRKKAEWASGSW